MRYFIIFYTHTNSKGYGHGYVGFDGDEYPNGNYFEKEMIKKCNYSSCIITNIQELTKEDYEEFFRD